MSEKQRIKPAMKQAAWISMLWKSKAFKVTANQTKPAMKQAAWTSLPWKSKSFIIVILALSAVRLLMLRGLVIYPLVSAGCDDALLTSWALNLLGGKWTGPFSCYIFTKEVGFSIYLAVIHRLRLPYIMATNLLYILGCLILLYAISHVVKQKWALCIIYAVTLFHPVMAAVHTGQRVYRNGFAVTLTLWAFGSLLNLYFEIAEKSFLRNCIWTVFAAGSLGFLWETKSDTIWVMPFTLAVLLATAFLIIKDRKKFPPVSEFWLKHDFWKKWGRKAQICLRMGLLVVPFLGIIFSSHFVDIVNTKVYGGPRIAYYGPATSLMTGIESPDSTENISLPRKTFQKLCSLSPTLASIQKQVEAEMDEYDKYDTHPGDGNVEDGWIGWALIESVAEAGYYENCQSANEFYQKVYEELMAAVNAGEIKQKEKSFWDSYHLSTAKDRKELADTIGEIISYVASHRDMYSDTCALEKESLIGSQAFEVVTRGRSYYKPMDTDYYCVGWVAYPGYDLKELEVYIEDEAGNRMGQIEFNKSEDVEELYSEVKGTEQCRFDLEWDYEGTEASPQFYIVGYDGDKQIARNGFNENGLLDADKKICIGSIDGYFNNDKIQENHKAAERAVNRCNFVYNIYHAGGNILAWAGLLSYAVFTVLALWGWFQKRGGARTGRSCQRQAECHAGNAWLVITGILLSLLVLFAGVAVTHLQNCPSISYMYLSASYPLFNLAAMLSILKCAEMIYQQVQRRKGAGSSNGADTQIKGAGSPNGVDTQIKGAGSSNGADTRISIDNFKGGSHGL